MKRTFFVSLILLACSYFASGQALEFDFVAGSERKVTMGQPGPEEYAKEIKPKRVTYKDGVLTITNIESGKQYDRAEVLRVVEFQKEKLQAYALEVKHKSGLYIYYVYQISKGVAGGAPFEAKSIVTPYYVEGRAVLEYILFEKK